jgi:hypothetical protein
MKQRYDKHMRTTVSLPDDLGDRARRHARREGLSLSALVARALDRLLSEPTSQPHVAPSFRLVVVKGTGPAPGIDLDRTSELLVAEDEATFGRARGDG